MFLPHTSCRACGYASTANTNLKQSLAAGGIYAPDEKLLPVFSLGLQPLANDFTKRGEEQAGYAPLDVLLCPRCHLAQLSVVVDPKILYARNYAYVTSQSEMMRQHFAALAEDIAGEMTPTSLLEIGSNDGLLLEYLKGAWGITKAVGVDPAPNLCRAARNRGVDTINDFFGLRCARDMGGFKPDVIIARHVLCHCDDWRDFFAGLEEMAGPETLICIETPYVQDLLDRVEFDTIYHEHLSYLSLSSIVHVLKGTKLRLDRVIRYPIHGGAVMLMLRHINNPKPVDKSVLQFLAVEAVTEGAWYQFRERVVRNVCELQHAICHLGGTVAALGASAKFTVLANYVGLVGPGNSRLDTGKYQRIAWVADSTPGKWYTTVPGTNIPVMDEGAILRELPDYVLLGCWNYERDCVEKYQLYLSKGGKFIVSVPRVRIIGADVNQAH